jgi:hypothetical protein
MNLTNMGLTIVARNPFSVAVGITTNQRYLERFQPGYAEVLKMTSQLPVNSKIYTLFEPRSYGISRSIQPDPILDNFAHDVFLYGSPQQILNTWRAEGYTHILLNQRNVEAVLESAEDRLILDQTMTLLKPTATSADGNYELLEIPE